MEFGLGLWAAGGLLALYAGGRAWSAVRAGRAREHELSDALDLERQHGRRLCLSLVESLSYAVEARTGHNLGHLARVQAYALATARELSVAGDVAYAIRLGALLHEIGRLGVPDNLLVKTGELNEEERQKLRAYPVLGSRLLAGTPLPWPVIPIVRHHREHFDGSGYPDGLCGEAIPLGARVLAVADAYDALVSPRAYRPGLTHAEAMASLGRSASVQFDPAVVAAFGQVVEAVNAELDDPKRRSREEEPADPTHEIARAHQEVQSLHELAMSVGMTLDLPATLEALAERVRAIVDCTACVVLLVEADGEYLRTHLAEGANASHFLNSRARIGAFLTGRAASRRTPLVASFLDGDLMMNACLQPWTPLRSTLVAPLLADDRLVGTINLYHSEPEAFTPDDVRVLGIVGELAGRGVENARLFAQTQETAFTDALTGLRNARFLRHYLDQELNRARKNDHAVAVLGMDLDQFKPVNDTYGHDRGDQVLREIGQVMRCEVRNYDMLARYAGDEFVLVLPQTDRGEAEFVAQKLKRAVQRYARGLVERDPSFPEVGVSVGIAMFPHDAEDAAGLLSGSDQQMYDDKRMHRSSARAA